MRTSLDLMIALFGFLSIFLACPGPGYKYPLLLVRARHLLFFHLVPFDMAPKRGGRVVVVSPSRGMAGQGRGRCGHAARTPRSSRRGRGDAATTPLPAAAGRVFGAMTFFCEF